PDRGAWAWQEPRRAHRHLREVRRWSTWLGCQMGFGLARGPAGARTLWSRSSRKTFERAELRTRCGGLLPPIAISRVMFGDSLELVRRIGACIATGRVGLAEEVGKVLVGLGPCVRP